MDSLVLVEPFEMCCMFLTEDEKDTTKNLVNQINNAKDIKKRFEEVADI